MEESNHGEHAVVTAVAFVYVTIMGITLGLSALFGSLILLCRSLVAFLDLFGGAA